MKNWMWIAVLFTLGTQAAMAQLETQREKIRKELTSEVEKIAQLVTEKLLVK